MSNNTGDKTFPFSELSEQEMSQTYLYLAELHCRLHFNIKLG
jgi:hypothetical protein